MIRRVSTSAAVWSVETLPDGSMGSLKLEQCRRINSIKIEDGLIVMDAKISLDRFEFKGQLVGGSKEIVFTIASHNQSKHNARSVALASPVVNALVVAGWVLRDVWRVMPDEF